MNFHLEHHDILRTCNNFGIRVPVIPNENMRSANWCVHHDSIPFEWSKLLTKYERTYFISKCVSKSFGDAVNVSVSRYKRAGCRAVKYIKAAPNKDVN
jgi:hypothetical protein